MKISSSNKKKFISFFYVLIFIGFIWTGDFFGCSIFSNIATGISWPFVKVANFIELSIGRINDGFSENLEAIQKLEKERDDQQAKIASLQEELRYFRSVSSPESLPKLTSWAPKLSSIIIRDEWFYGLRFAINIGCEEGVEVGNVVLQKGVVIGRIINCQEKTSQVATLLDPHCRLSVKVKGTNLIGIMSFEENNGASELIINYLPMSDRYEEGVQIVTSGFSKQVPGNLPVGKLKAINDEKVVQSYNRLYQQGTVKPYFNYNGDRQVVVMTRNKKNK